MTTKGVIEMANDDYHAFAAKATDAAATVVDSEDISFYGGSMFVYCDSYQAAAIKAALVEALKCGVIVSKIGSEYGFDFTERA
jgi:hypothetical protein